MSQATPVLTFFICCVCIIGCGVKGAPLPRQDSAYIFNQNLSPETENQNTNSVKDSAKESVKEKSGKNENDK